LSDDGLFIAKWYLKLTARVVPEQQLSPLISYHSSQLTHYFW
jgi:hypothetical protein